MYYYFWKNKKILETRTPLPTQFNPSVVELTPEQVEFYLANPTATIQEVMNCALTPPYVPPTPDVQEYANEKVRELKEACYATVTIDELQYAMANAVLAGTSIAYAGKKHYSTTEAISVMKQFMDESDKASTVYETYKPRIEAAITTKIVDDLYEEAINSL